MRETRGLKGRALAALVCLFCALALTPATAFAEDAANANDGGEDQVAASAGTGQVSGTMGGTTFLAAAKDGVITLTGDVEITDEASVNVTSDLTIDLGTHNLKLGKKGLTVNGGTLTLTGSGTITSANNGSLVSAESGATVIVDGCTIQASTYKIALKVNGSTAQIKSGTLKSSNDSYSAPVSVSNSGTVTMTGGTIEANGNISKAVEITKNSTMNMTDGAIICNSSKSEIAAVQVGMSTRTDCNNSEFTMTGGTIQATGTGNFGVYAQNGGNNPNKVTIDGSANVSGTEAGVVLAGSTGTISGGYVKGRFGVYPGVGATLTVTGGTIDGTDMGIGTNGLNKPGSTINISGGTVKGGQAGMYLPSNKEGINTVTITGGDIYGSAGIVDIGSSLDISYGGNVTTSAAETNSAPPTVTATGEKTVNVGDADAQQYKPAALIIANQASNTNYNTKYGTDGATINITDGTFINKEQAKTTSPIVSGTFNSDSEMPTDGGPIKDGVTVSGGLFSPSPDKQYCDTSKLVDEWVIYSDTLGKDITVAGGSKGFYLTGSGTPDLTGIADALNLKPQHIDITEAPEDVAEMYVSGGWTATNKSKSNITIHNDTGSTGPGLDIKPGETVDVPKENTVVAIQTEHGTISVSNKDAKVGETVTITTKPDEGYLVDSVAVTGKDGKAIEAKDGADGTYTFTMPASSAHPVTVKAFFAAEPKIETVAVYRLYNQYAKTHLYTSDLDEKATLIDAGWTPDNQDKPLWYAPKTKGTDDTTILRFFNPYTDDHYFCPATDTTQIAKLKADGWKQDSAASNLISAPSTGEPVYTLFNKYNQVDTHLYTSDETERATRLGEDGWEEHDTVIYAVPVTES